MNSHEVSSRRVVYVADCYFHPVVIPLTLSLTTELSTVWNLLSLHLSVFVSGSVLHRVDTACSTEAQRYAYIFFSVCPDEKQRQSNDEENMPNDQRARPGYAE